MGCASAKHVATVQNEEEAQKGKNYQNGDVFGDEYRIKPVEEVKYMKNGAEEEQKIAARNQENLSFGKHILNICVPRTIPDVRKKIKTRSLPLRCSRHRMGHGYMNK
ncbi:PREDICTED: uncharacterized protein C1orf21 homolog isoform X2 [Cercocebus atys]|nr:PREDICTED: uncharacterized protein C1orf21 homolog isoform X2 [Cercocebus atys]